MLCFLGRIAAERVRIGRRYGVGMVLRELNYFCGSVVIIVFLPIKLGRREI